MNQLSNPIASASSAYHETVNEIAIRIRTAVAVEGSVALHEPNLGELEERYVTDCVRSGWVSSVGKYVDRFEKQLSEYTGCAYAVATVNGTSALHVGLLLAGVLRNDEVICPALSFVATANAIGYCGAVPHFIDVDERTLGLDPEKIRYHLAEISHVEKGQLINRHTGRRIAAIVPMHTLGHSCDLDGLQEVANSFALPIVEDAAESLGTFYRGRHTGTIGLAGALSFNGNKIMTTGGGGAILTNDRELAMRAKHITTTAKLPHRWQYCHDQAGFNYRMPNLNAAMGCAQLERFDELRDRKRTLATRYREQFVGFSAASFVNESENESSNFWLNAIKLTGTVSSEAAIVELRDSVLQSTNESGLMTRPMWNLLNELPMYRDCPQSDLDTSRSFAQRVICLPSSANLG